MKTSSTRLTLLLLAVSLIVIGGTGCRTFQGLGRDVQHTGQHIEHAARR